MVFKAGLKSASGKENGGSRRLRWQQEALRAVGSFEGHGQQREE